jgi:signal transduction histidine kinase
VTGRAERRRRALHELRGALSAVGLGVELAGRTGVVPPERFRALSLELQRATQALDDLAGLRRRPAPVPGQSVAVAELLADSVEAWRPAAGERELRLELGRCGLAVVHGSPARLAQATGNLIANAIEHGAGTVTVSARCSERSVRIEVCDAGAGLPASLARVMRRRSRFAWPRAHQARGHGLRIVDQVARAHGGRLEAAPSSAGARLVLELPLVEVRRDLLVRGL